MGDYNLVLEGGGVKGIGLVGAASALEKNGCTFCGIAGTSAGAIVASLMAAGFSPDEMRNILITTDYRKFREKTFIDNFGIIGFAASLFINYGMYSSNYFEKWLGEILLRKGVAVFGDIKNRRSCSQKYKFQAVASDITAKRILVLPDDLVRFGIEIDKFSVAQAVKMSMSIPLFFEPVIIKDKYLKPHTIVDGGILSNYPLWLFDNDDKKTISLRFKENSGLELMGDKEPDNFINYLKHIVETMLEAHDKRHIKFREGDFGRTVFIDTEVEVSGKKKYIKSTKFDIEKSEVAALYANGVKAGQSFINRQRNTLFV